MTGLAGCGAPYYRIYSPSDPSAPRPSVISLDKAELTAIDMLQPKGRTWIPMTGLIKRL